MFKIREVDYRVSECSVVTHELSMLLFHGYVKYILAKAIATGGQAHMIVEGSRYLKIVDEHLTLQGLQMIWERNHPQPSSTL
jgi:hypothetical protein